MIAYPKIPTVWIVTEYWDYEGEHVMGVFATNRKAMNFKRRRLAEKPNCDGYHIREWSVY